MSADTDKKKERGNGIKIQPHVRDTQNEKDKKIGRRQEVRLGFSFPIFFVLNSHFFLPNILWKEEVLQQACE